MHAHPQTHNPIGLSSVRLLRIEDGDLIVSGADVLDGTPIYDIKPYLSFSDSHEGAQNGFAGNFCDYRLAISDERLRDIPDEIRRDIEYILSQDPRPGYQDDPDREYKLDYAGWNVAFVVQNGTVIVKNIQKM